jgi:hypothetical protein
MTDGPLEVLTNTKNKGFLRAIWYQKLSLQLKAHFEQNISTILCLSSDINIMSF